MNDPWSRCVTAFSWRTGKVRAAWHSLMVRLIESRSLASFSIGPGVECLVPLRVAGGRGGLIVGEGVVIGFPGGIKFGTGAVMLQPRSVNSQIRIGRGTRFNNNVSIIANTEVLLGENCLIGDMVTISDSDGHGILPGERGASPGKTQPVKIGDNVWLGSRVTVLKGVEIGSNTVVGAMSVVTRSLPPDSIAIGNPARVIRSL